MALLLRNKPLSVTHYCMQVLASPQNAEKQHIPNKENELLSNWKIIIQLRSVRVPLVTRKMEYIQALKVNYSYKIMSAESHFSFRVQYL